MPPAQGSYLTFLPQDEADGTDPEAEDVISLLASELQDLLLLPDVDFCRTVAGNKSLVASIDSYLQHSRRQHDETAPVAGESSAARASLHRAIFLVIYRTLETGGGGKALPLLSIPRLLDVAALYGSDNATLTGHLIAKAFRLQPGLAAELSDVATSAAQNVADVCTACTARAQSAKPLPADIVEGLTDGALYLRDMCLTLSAFLAASPASAPIILGESAQFLIALAVVHDELLPALESAAQHVKPPAPSMLRLLGHLRLAVVHLAAMLLQDSCLAAHDPLPGASAVLPAAAAGDLSAMWRGELLLTSLVVLGQAPVDGSGTTSFLSATSRHMSLPAATSAAAAAGVITLDAAQHDYLSALLGAPLPGAPAGMSSSSGPAGAPSQQLQAAERALPQVRDVLPGYGDGFLTAALLHFGGAAEKVVDALLDGPLPAALAHLDPQAATIPQNIGSINPGVSVPSDSAGGSDGVNIGGVTWQGLAAEAVVNEREGALPHRPPPVPSAATRLRPAHRATARALDSADASTRGAIRAAACAAQWEDDDDDDGVYGGPAATFGDAYGGGGYGDFSAGGGEYDDEYDDSFDAYGGGAADGVADAEGEDARGTASTPAAAVSIPRGPGRLPSSHPRPDARDRSSATGGASQPRANQANDSLPNAQSATRQASSRQQQQQQEQAHKQRQQQRRDSATAAVNAARAALAPWRDQPQQQPHPQRDTKDAQHQQTDPRVADDEQRNKQQARARKPQKAWIKDGKVYNYAKEGATLVDGPSAARTAATVAAQAAAEIHGLGRGGNVPYQPQQPGMGRTEADDGSDEAGVHASPGRGAAGGRGRGRGNGASSSSEGTKAAHLRKDQHKASVANHHRKERAARKQGMF